MGMKFMLRRILGEGFHTLRVTTYHPLRWSLQHIQERVSKVLAGEIPLDANRKSSPILFVHGIFHNSTAFYKLEKEAKKLGFSSTRTLELWTTFSSFEELVERLKTEVRLLLKSPEYMHIETPKKVHIVAHSLGGMIVRGALLDEQFSKKIEKVIFLGTPHQGNPLFKSPIPFAIKSLHENAEMMKKIKMDPLPGNIQYWNLRGGLDLITPLATTFLPDVPNLVFDGVGHAGLLSNRDVTQTVLAILDTEESDFS